MEKELTVGQSNIPYDNIIRMDVKDYDNVIERINNIILKDNMRAYGITVENVPQFRCVMDSLANCWNKFSEESKLELSKMFVGGFQKHYLSNDLRWILYSYICDLNTEISHIRCGKYAFYKLSNIFSNTDICNDIYIHGVFNGEDVCLYKTDDLDKKQIIISRNETIAKQNMESSMSKNIEIYPDDVVLYFA